MATCRPFEIALSVAVISALILRTNSNRPMRRRGRFFICFASKCCAGDSIGAAMRLMPHLKCQLILRVTE